MSWVFKIKLPVKLAGQKHVYKEAFFVFIKHFAPFIQGFGLHEDGGPVVVLVVLSGACVKPLHKSHKVM